MIEANKSKRFSSFFQRYVRYLLKKHFYRIHFYQASQEPLPSSAIWVINHSSWWDSLVLFYMNAKKYNHDLYGMMAEEGLKKFPFFRKIGVYSMNGQSIAGIKASLRYSEQLLEEGKTIAIFPQGKEEHIEKRPLTFLDGTSYLIRKQKARHVVPITFYYTFLHEARPEIFIYVGTPIQTETFANQTRKEITTELEHRITTQLETMKQHIIEETFTTYETMEKGRKTASEWLLFFKRMVKRDETFMDL